MESVTKYNVYVDDKLVMSYDSQAPATTYAKYASRRNGGRRVDVVEEVFANVSSRSVRYCVEGKIYAAD